MADDKQDKADDKKEGRERPEQSATTTIDTPHGRCEVTASTINLKGADGKDRASIFSVAYVREGGDATRPVTFCFNGGPGSSAVWLQFGAFGPKRVDMPDIRTAPPPPNRLVDNPHGLLDITDLVFIDPVGTGFSRAAGTTEDGEFHSVKTDVESIGEFIWRWLSRHDRWQSPRYLAGESYGTTRAAALAQHLQKKGVACNGLILVSLALSFHTFVEEAGNDLPHVLYLPSYAAVAAYHGKVEVPGGDLDAWLREVREFAVEQYAPALLMGARLPADLRTRIAATLAAWTGLPQDELERRNLRIPYLWFARNVLGSSHHDTVGRLDARFVGPDLDPHGVMLTRDPSYDAAIAAYTSATNDFLRRAVGFETDEPYELLSMKINQAWKWDQDRMGFADTADELRQALVANPHLRVLFANGLYDLATPFFAAEHTADHLGLMPGVSGRLTLTYYPAGHMMYFHPPSLAQLKTDIAAFMNG